MTTSSVYFSSITAGWLERLWKQDIKGALGYFDEDAIIFESFSKAGQVKGRSEIGEFLRLISTLCNGTKYRIRDVTLLQSADSGSPDDKAIIDVEFVKGYSAAFRFRLDYDSTQGDVPIRVLAVKMEPA